MKTKKKFLIGLMSLCLLAGTGTALALSVTKAEGQVNQSVDSAVVFSWGQDTIPSISSLKGGVAQYTFFNAKVDSTKSVQGRVTLNFNLSAETTQAGKTAVLTGLTATVYQADSEVTAGNAADYAVAGNLKATLTSGSPNGSAYFDVNPTAGAANLTRGYYVVKLLYDGTALGANQVLDGKVTIVSAWGAQPTE